MLKKGDKVHISTPNPEVNPSERDGNIKEIYSNGETIELEDGYTINIVPFNQEGGIITVVGMSEDTSEPINTELQNIEERLTELIQYVDSDDDINDLTKALNHVRVVKHRLYGTWF